MRGIFFIHRFCYESFKKFAILNISEIKMKMKINNLFKNWFVKKINKLENGFGGPVHKEEWLFLFF